MYMIGDEAGIITYRETSMFGSVIIKSIILPVAQDTRYQRLAAPDDDVL